METSNRRESRVRILAESCLLAVVLLPGLAIWTWVSGVVDLLTLGPGHVVMAPLTALLTGLCGFLALFGRGAIWEGNRRGIGMVRGLVLAVAISGLLIGIRPAFGWRSLIEEWLVGRYQSADGRPLGVTAPLLGWGVLLAAAVLWSRTVSRQGAGWRAAERLLSSLLCLGGVLFAAAYLGGFSVLPDADGREAPIALWSAWGLLFLGFGLLGTTGRGGEKERPEPVFGGFTLSHDVAVPLLLTVTLAVLVSGVGALYLRHEQRATRLAHHDELRAITNLKVDQIRNWRKERIGDARFFANAEFVRRDVKGLLAATTSEAARQEVSRWMELLRISERYETVRLYDAAWGLVLGVPESPANTRPRSEKEFAAKLPVERALLSDLQPQAGTGQPRLELAAMVSAVPEGPPLAYLVMEVNPDQFLFPLIRRWPMPTRTAEAVLVRAEGEEVVYLNDVRHGTGTALPMRQRLEAASRSPAVRAAAGEEGVTEGIDYRGEPVLAAMISVEDTGWHLIGKIDRREVYARLQEQAWMTLGLVVGLSGLSGLGVGLFTLRRDRRLERQRAALAERLALLMRQANDIVVVLDGGWRIIEANERAVAAYGWAEGELKTRTLRDLFGVEPSDPDTTEGRIWAGEDGRREAVHRRNDGRMFPVEMSQHSSLIGGQVFHQLIIRDITERKAQEARLSRVNRALRTLTETSQVLVRADDEPRLLHDVCRLVVEIGGYRLAWVGYAEQDERRSIRPVARAGDDEGYVDAIRATWDEGELGQGPGGAAIRGGRASVFRDLRHDPRFERWRPEALKRGFASAIGLPLMDGERAFGVLLIYSDRQDAFDAEEEGMLVELAADLGFGIRTLRVRAERDRVTQSLRRREELFRCLFDSSVVGILVADAGGWIREANNTFLNLIGYATSDLPLSWDSLTPPEWKMLDAQRIAKALSGEEMAPAEKEYYRRDGRRVPVLLGVAPIPGSQGGVVGFVLDISSRKLTEERLWVESARLASLSANVPAIMFQLALRPDGSMNCLYISDACHDILGIDPGEVQTDIRTLLDLPHPDEKAGFDAIIREAIRTQGPWRWVGRAAGRRGERWVEGEAIPHALSDGTIVWDGVIVDVTSRRHSDEALRASEERYRRLFEDNPHPMWVYDLQSLAFLEVNGAAVRTYGHSREEFLGMTLPEIHPAEDLAEVRESVRRADCGQRRTEIWRHRTKDGRIIHVQTTSHEVPMSGRRAELVLAQDVTEQRRLEQEKSELEARLRQQQKLESIGTLASGVAHEINNPINGVMNYAQLVLDDAEAGSPTAEYAGEILNETARVADIVRHLLQFARQEKRGKEPAQVKDVVSSTVALVRTSMRQDHIQIELELPNELPLLRCRSHQIKQVLMNLLTNARDALNERYPGMQEGKRIVIRAGVESRAERRWLRLTVEDNGSGIPAGIRERIFDPFFTTKPRERGTGLGLSISHGMVLEHQGQLHFETEPGVGTRFHVDLPLFEESEIHEPGVEVVTGFEV